MLHDIRKTRPIGEGAFGQVFEGVWQGTTRIAMKRLSDPSHASAFQKEAALLRDLRHPNVVMFLGLVKSLCSFSSSFERGKMNSICVVKCIVSIAMNVVKCGLLQSIWRMALCV